MLYFCSVLVFNFIGCYDESCNRNTFNFTSGNMTTALCIASCKDGGMRIAGLQHGNTCYCGNLTCDQDDIRCDIKCGMPCSGDRQTVCGGLSVTQLYKSEYSDINYRIACMYLH